MPRRMTLVPLTLLLALLAEAGAQTVDYRQYQSMESMRDFYEQKVLDNVLYRSIEFLDPAQRPMPGFEAYHESDVYEIGRSGDAGEASWLGTLRTGAKLNIALTDPASLANRLGGGDLGAYLSPSVLQLFLLAKFSFLSEPTGYAPVLEIPFPYMMASEQSAVELLPGLSLSLGDPTKPTLQASVGHSFFMEGSEGISPAFASIDPTTVFDLRSPALGGFFQLVRSGDASALGELGSLDFFRYGFMGNLGWLFRLMGDSRPFFELLKAVRRQPSGTDGIATTTLGLRRLFGFLDLDYSYDHGEALEARTDWWRVGLDLRLDRGDAYSSVYRTMAVLRGGLCYSNVDGLPGIFLLPPEEDEPRAADSEDKPFLDVRGLGWYVELNLQNPFIQTLDWFHVFLMVNLAVLQSLNGDESGYESTQRDIEEKIEEMSAREASGAYRSKLFDRLTIGYELNRPETIDLFPFVLDQGRIYVYLSVFL